MSNLKNPSPSGTSNNLEALQQAAQNWDTTLIAELLKNGTDCMGTNAVGETVLHLTLKNKPGDDSQISKVIETIKIFYGAGVDLNARDKSGKTVLHVAFKSKLMGVVKSLIELGSNINAPDFHGNTIAHYLVESLSNVTSDQFDHWRAIYCLEWLLSKGLDVDYKNKNQNAPVHMVAKLDFPEVILTFVKHSKNINSADNEGRTVFHLLMKRNGNTPKTTEVCEELLLQGCSVNVTDILGNTPVHIAAKEKNISMLRLMLKNFTNVNAMNDHGETALSALLKVCWDESVQQEEGIVGMVSSLIDKGTNIYTCKKGFLSPIQLAAQCKHAEIFQTVVARVSNLGELCNESSLLHYLCNYANNPAKNAEYAEMIDFLVSKGGNVNNKDVYGKTPLHLAAQSATTVVVQKLIENKADVHSREPSGWWTPLHLAVKSQRFEAINSLVDGKADIDAKDSKGRTSLHHAAILCTSRITGLLLESGADIDARDNKNRLPFYYAVERHNLSAIEDLLKYGADVNDATVFRCLSRLKRNEDVLARLMEHWCKLKMAKIKVVKYYKKYRTNLSLKFLRYCVEEIKILKSTYIDSSTTFYEFLHMTRNRRCAYTNDDKFCKLCESTNFAKKFPRYHVLILALYHRAVKRKSLLKVASRNWYEITKIYLPDVCLYNIFNNLTNEELKCLNMKNADVITGLKRRVQKPNYLPLAKRIKRRRH